MASRPCLHAQRSRERDCAALEAGVGIEPGQRLERKRRRF
jgi:hypothetical protein